MRVNYDCSMPLAQWQAVKTFPSTLLTSPFLPRTPSSFLVSHGTVSAARRFLIEDTNTPRRIFDSHFICTVFLPIASAKKLGQSLMIVLRPERLPDCLLRIDLSPSHSSRSLWRVGRCLDGWGRKSKKANWEKGACPKCQCARPPCPFLLALTGMKVSGRS